MCYIFVFYHTETVNSRWDIFFDRDGTYAPNLCYQYLPYEQR